MRAAPSLLFLSASLILGGPATALFGGCASSAHQHQAQKRAFVETPGDWDDVSAVVAGIIPRLDYVVDAPSVDSDEQYIVAIRSPRFGEGTVCIDRLDGNRVRIHSRVGRFGRPEEEEYIQRALASRFTRLLGDVVAPIELPTRRRP